MGLGKFVNNVMVRDYEGDLYELDVFAGYDKITCTPNHKFLTEDGWIRADRIVPTRPNQFKYRIGHYIKTPTLKFEPEQYKICLSDFFEETDLHKIEYLTNKYENIL